MSDLFLISGLFGLAIIAGVVLFNWRQEKKFRERIADDFQSGERDPLIDDDFKIDTNDVAVEETHAPTIAETPVAEEEPAVVESATTDDADASEEQLLDFEEADELAVAEDADENSEQEREAAAQKASDDLSESYITVEPVITEEQADDPLQEYVADDDKAVEFEPEQAQHNEQMPPPPPAPTIIASKKKTVSASLNIDKPDDTQTNTLDVTEEPPKPTLPDALPILLNPKIDLIATLTPSMPISLDNVLSLSKPFNADTSRIFALGYNVDYGWLPLNRASQSDSFTQLVYGLQLADRNGPVLEKTYNEFKRMVESLGHDIAAKAEWKMDEDVMAYANALDQFCMEVDQTVSFHLLANDGASFHGTKLRGLMEAQGLTLSDDGKFHYYNVDDPEILEFSVKNLEGNAFSVEMLKNAVVRGSTFQLDIAKINNSVEVFNHMVLTAKSIAQSLDAELIDDNKNALSDSHLDKIRQQLKAINSKMQDKGIEPGSADSLRLFS